MTLRARLTLGILGIAVVLVVPLLLALRSADPATFASINRYAAAELLVAALLATGIAVWLTRSVSRPVRDLEAGMTAVAAGAFAHRLAVAPHRRDEFGRLAASFASMAGQLGELDKLKAEFVSIASHELKTPINVMLGYLQLLQEGVYGPLSERQIEVCRTLEQQCQAVARLSKQLLDVSRFEAGGGQLDPHPFLLSPFLDEVEASVHVLAIQRGVQFNIVRDARLPVEVVWDRDGISEVLGNLLSNAFRFTPAGGHVELAAHADEEQVRLYVRDTGSGIPPEQLGHIFDKFYQADNQRPTAGKGAGLGLAIAKTIIDAHGGRISVESTLGTGTVFSLSLPPAVGLESSRLRRVAASELAHMK
jgi:signal transduction histidine kinase